MSENRTVCDSDKKNAQLKLNSSIYIATKSAWILPRERFYIKTCTADCTLQNIHIFSSATLILAFFCLVLQFMLNQTWNVKSDWTKSIEKQQLLLIALFRTFHSMLLLYSGILLLSLRTHCMRHWLFERKNSKSEKNVFEEMIWFTSTIYFIL